MHTMLDPLRRATQICAGHTAIVDRDHSLTYADLWHRCAKLVGALQAMGLDKGDRVAILSNNSSQYLEAYLAVPSAGMIIVPMNTRHAMPELTYALQDSGARILLTDREDVGPLAALVEHVIRIPDAYEQTLQAAPEGDIAAGVHEDDVAGLFYTGGTTGKSKGVMLTHRNLISNAYNWLTIAPHTPDDTVLVMSPLFHAAGTNGVLGAIWEGSKQVVLNAFNPVAALDLVEQHRVTITLGVPAMIAAMAEEQHSTPRDVSSLSVLAHAGSPIARQTIRRAHAAFPTAQLMEGYGATETAPIVSFLRQEEALLDDPRLRSCGRPAINCSVSICSPDGTALSAGTVGEVVVRGSNIMKGYWNKPEQTAEVLKDGAYWTGDLGYMDDDGYLYLVDRSKDMIISGGENVYSTEIEDVLYHHPAVLEAAVFGIPHDTWGEAVHAVVVLRPGHSDVGAEDLIAFCRESLAGYKLPKAIDFSTEELPKSGPGKVLKRQLRAPFWEGADRKVN
jgi:long-chain acyl-CoA synthetase